MVPKLKMYVGPMFSGKSTKLIQQIERYKIAKKNIICFKPAMDTRYTKEGFIITHSELHVPCYLVNSSDDILRLYQEKSEENMINAVAIDEAFMIEDISKACLSLVYNQKIDVLVSSIDMSASLIAFDEISKLMCHATHVKKCKSVCTVCGDDASYTMRKFSKNKEDEIQVGGEDMYEARCLDHHSGLDLWD
jgi:thymidine kinase